MENTNIGVLSSMDDGIVSIMYAYYLRRVEESNNVNAYFGRIVSQAPTVQVSYETFRLVLLQLYAEYVETVHVGEITAQEAAKAAIKTSSILAIYLVDIFILPYLRILETSTTRPLNKFLNNLRN